MKIINYASEAKPDTVVRLTLENDGDNCEVICVNERGDRISALVGIQSNGRIRRHRYVGSHIGLDLDDEGRVKLTDEE